MVAFSVDAFGLEHFPLLFLLQLHLHTMCDLVHLYTPRGVDFCCNLKRLVREAWACDELIPQVMCGIVCQPRELFKIKSNKGGVWMNRASTDIGNFAYALLYILMMEDAKENSNAPYGVPRMYGYASERYEALDINHSNWELKADVIECFLEAALTTGPAIHVDDVQERLRFMSFMRGYVSCFDDFLHIVSQNGLLTEGRPLVRHLPDLHETVRVITERAEW